jgi:DNA repair protein RecO (recombination protein O)
MISKTHGIALRIDPFSKTSQIVSWLTPDKGRLSTLVKGALRPRSPFLGQYDLFYTCELIYYPGLRSSLAILKECSPLTWRTGLRGNWKSCLAASYFADLVHRLTPVDVSNGALYRFVGRMLDFLSKQGGNINTLHWAELKLLTMLGVGPRLRSCVSCGSHDIQSSRPTAFSVPRGGLLCPPCSTRTGEPIIPVSHDALAMLRLWQKAPTPFIAKRTACTEPQHQTIDRILGGFLAYHLESTRARVIVMEML